MKLIKNIESTRREYHRDARINTVHRSSLLAPNLPDCDVDVSFVNHFLLKRGYRDVACRISAFDAAGRLIETSTFPVEEPRVYAVELGQYADDNAENFQLEFFSGSNLFIPFPAAIVNHRNDHFLNSVHSYNRVLNDVFEDDSVNSKHVREASIDLRVDEATDTFAVFTAGPSSCRDSVEVSVRSSAGDFCEQVPVDVGRLGNSIVSLKSLFGDKLPEGGVLTLQQPQQAMFYGRMLAGQRDPANGAFSANHSFYDCSRLEEYWDDASPSVRVYPLFDSFDVRIRLYPIFSPCRLLGAVDFYGPSGEKLASVDCEPCESPSPERLDFSVTDAMKSVGADQATSFRYRAWPDGANTPKRINHQIVYGDADRRDAFSASVAISLRNPNAFQPKRSNALVWGQCAISADLDTRVGIVFDHADGSEQTVKLKFIGEAGVACERSISINAGSAFTVDPAELVPDLVADSGGRPHYLWYWVTADRNDLAAYSVTRHRRSGHCTGEHNF